MDRAIYSLLQNFFVFTDSKVLIKTDVKTYAWHTRQVFMSKEFFLTVVRASERSFSWSSVPAKLPPPFNCVSEWCLYWWVGGYLTVPVP